MKPTNPTQRFSDLQKQGFMKLGRKNVRKAKVAKPIVACDECHDWHVKGKHTKGQIQASQAGCGHQLSEAESNYYDNRSHLVRLCKRCTMEERAR